MGQTARPTRDLGRAARAQELAPAQPPHPRLTLAQTPIVLTPDRAVFWPAAATLLIADLHLGKSRAFQAAGVPLPDAETAETLARLSRAREASGARRVIVLGDLLHARTGLTESLRAEVREWRRGFSAEILLVPGNHDRAIASVADEWGVTLAPPTYREGPFEFSHDPATCDPAPGMYAWAGHVHPAFILRDAGARTTLPAFWIGPRVGVLPAFSRLTGGVAPRASADAAVYAIANDRVLRVG